jgi:hypothetical protein
VEEKERFISAVSAAERSSVSASEGGLPAVLDGLPLHGLIQGGEADQEIDRPARWAQAPEQRADKVRSRETHYSPIQTADHEQHGGDNVELFHMFPERISEVCLGNVEVFYPTCAIMSRFDVT